MAPLENSNTAHANAQRAKQLQLTRCSCPLREVWRTTPHTDEGTQNTRKQDKAWLRGREAVSEISYHISISNLLVIELYVTKASNVI